MIDQRKNNWTFYKITFCKKETFYGFNPLKKQLN